MLALLHLSLVTFGFLVSCLFATLKEDAMSIWTILFVVLLIAWLGGFTVFHVAGGLIHLLLVFAIISLILHFVMGARTV
jgi:uncharacterized protein DUF5670